MAKKYCKDILQTVKDLEAFREMTFGEIKLTIAIDPRNREQAAPGTEVKNTTSLLYKCSLYSSNKKAKWLVQKWRTHWVKSSLEKSLTTELHWRSYGKKWLIGLHSTSTVKSKMNLSKVTLLALINHRSLSARTWEEDRMERGSSKASSWSRWVRNSCQFGRYVARMGWLQLSLSSLSCALNDRSCCRRYSLR